MSLFDSLMESSEKEAPLAHRMRPRTLDDFLGQEHLLAPGKPLAAAIARDQLFSFILWGPPGCGKTSLARLIATLTKSFFEEFSAVTSGIAEVRKVVAQAEQRRINSSRRTILFVDEIHRFNKAQQDAFLPHVEKGSIILLGATTENPAFEIISPLASRLKIFKMESLSEEFLGRLLDRALKDPERGLGGGNLLLSDSGRVLILEKAGGDARSALNSLELGAFLAKEKKISEITEDILREALSTRTPLYDKQGDYHYDTISAFIKSLRGSDPDAAIYWLARMLEAGEDPRFIVRRMVIAASEDVGNADPMALVVATAASHALELVGLPEAQIPMAQAAAYIACAPKSNASYDAICRARKDVQSRPLEPVPLHLRNSPSPYLPPTQPPPHGGRLGGGKGVGIGEGYKYPHDFPGNFVHQEYRPLSVKNRIYYEPSENGYEKIQRENLARWRGQS